MAMEFPEELRYAETHEWVRVQGDTAEMGISAYAVEEIGDLTYIELPRVGAEFRKGDPIGIVESVKDTFDIFAPVSGRVTEVHRELADELDTVRRDPYGAGWLVRLRLSAPAEVETLMSAQEYAAKVSRG